MDTTPWLASLSGGEGSSVVESILEELRSRDGELFQKAQPQALFGAVRALVLKRVGGPYQELIVKSNKPEAYDAIMTSFHEWHAPVATREVALATELHINPPFHMLLQQVAFLYAKMLYRKCDFAKWSMKRPSVETLLRGVYTRLADPLSSSGMRDGSFFRLDAVKQDYILRQVLREALSDCIEVYERDTGRPIAPDGKGGAVIAGVSGGGDGKGYKDKDKGKDKDCAYAGAAVARALAATAAAPVAAGGAGCGGGASADEGDGVPEGDVFPSDSISSVSVKGGSDELERPRLDLPADAKSAHTSKSVKSVKDVKAPAPAPTPADDLRSVRSSRDHSKSVATASSARSAMSRASQQRKPRVLDGVDEDPVAAAEAKPKRKVILTHEPDSPPRHKSKSKRDAGSSSGSEGGKSKGSSESGTTKATRSTATTRTTATAAS